MRLNSFLDCTALCADRGITPRARARQGDAAASLRSFHGNDARANLREWLRQTSLRGVRELGTAERVRTGRGPTGRNRNA